MALKKLYFSVVRDAGLAEASTVIHCVGEHLRARLSQRDYGPGVAWVIIFVNMLEGRWDNFRRSHIYEPGKRTVDLDGIEYEIENVIKILISPDLAAIRSATSVGDVVDALKVAL